MGWLGTGCFRILMRPIVKFRSIVRLIKRIVQVHLVHVMRTAGFAYVHFKLHAVNVKEEPIRGARLHAHVVATNGLWFGTM